MSSQPVPSTVPVEVTPPAPAVVASGGGRSKEAKPKTIGEVFSFAGKKALQGGLPGAAAMAIQVVSLMWMRTTMNYQYRYGTSTREAMRTLYSQGGIPRFYRGLLPALFQGPLSRFGDTAANAGMLALWDQNEFTKSLPVAAKTLSASVASGLFRIVLMPIDTLKTTMQVEGKDGLKLLAAKMRASGPQVLYAGSLGAWSATIVGHFPWFFTYNWLQETIPRPKEMWPKLGRNAFIGFCSSVVSDCCSNSLRVVKTTKQTSAKAITYPEAVNMVIKADGIAGLFGRGLSTRIATNGLQGLLFSVLWNGFQDMLNARDAKKAAEEADK